MKLTRTRWNVTQVFISHAPSDEQWAKELACGLQAAGLRVWMDELELGPGDNWALRIGKALEESNFMVVVISPQAMKTVAVRRELEFALGSLQYAYRLLGVVVKPTRNIPRILRELHLVRMFKTPKEAAKGIVQEFVRGIRSGPRGVRGPSLSRDAGKRTAQEVHGLKKATA